MAQSSTKRLAELFRGNESAHGTHGAPDRDPDGLKWTIKRTAQTLRGGATDELWADHVAGKVPLGIIPIRGDNTCVWGSIDFDEYDVDLVEIIARVEAHKLPLVPCRSKSGGLHLFLFLREPKLAAEVQDALKMMASTVGLAQCEIFPKQRQILTDRGDAGNWMVAPYFGGDFGGKLKMQHGLKKGGEDMTLSEFVAAAESRLVDEAQLGELARPPARSQRNGAATGPRKRRRGDGDAQEDFHNGPPCLQNLTSEPLTEGRKRALFMMALYYWRADRSNWKKHVEEANARYMKPPLPAEEVAGVIRSLSKKESSGGDQYQYKCKDEPMCSHCNSGLCRTRKYGVGNGDTFPQISGLAKLDTEPVIWFVDVSGVRIEVTSTELQNYSKFHLACLEKGLCHSLMSQAAWIGMVGEAMQNLVVIEAPPEIGIVGQFRYHLNEFLVNRARGQRSEDLLMGRPWQDEKNGRHYFVFEYLMAFLQKQKFNEKHQRIVSMIEQLGGKRTTLPIRGAPGGKKNVYFVPADAVEGPTVIPPPQAADGEETSI